MSIPRSSRGHHSNPACQETPEPEGPAGPSGLDGEAEEETKRNFLEAHAGKILLAGILLQVPLRLLAMAYGNDDPYTGGVHRTPGETRELLFAALSLLTFLVMAVLALTGYTMRRERARQEAGEGADDSSGL